MTWDFCSLLFFGKEIALKASMKISMLTTLLLWLTMSTSQIQYSDLVGEWQLVYFDGIEKVKASPQYQSSGPEFRSGVEAKINFRLENTVYKFKTGDILEYTDFEKFQIVLKQAKIELADGNIITIHDKDEIKKAQIVELDGKRLVIQPIGEEASGGKLVFERIQEKKE